MQEVRCVRKKRLATGLLVILVEIGAQYVELFLSFAVFNIDFCGPTFFNFDFLL